MRILVQKVKEASVSIKGEKISQIGRGFLLLVGLGKGDDFDIAKKMANKVCKLRIFPDSEGKTNLSLEQVNGSILCVSQFTLYADSKEGNRPSFFDCLPIEEAKSLYAEFYSYLSALVPNVQGGVFQEDMDVALINEGPFTLMLDSKELFGK